ncbi:MAG: cache domain-containing protein [Gammaproteobacteria bacterium]|nr:cache domain-containing protein [Gammaproteobacteria bacterium]
MNINRLNIVSAIILPMLLLAVAVIVGYLGLAEIERQVRVAAGNSLSTVLQATNESHSLWLEEKYSKLRRMVEDPELVSSVRKLLRETIKNKNLTDNQQLRAIRQYFETKMLSSKHTGFSIISRDYINIASFDDREVGLKSIIFKKHPELIERSLTGETVFIPPIKAGFQQPEKSIEKNPSLFFVAPIKDKGKVLALLGIRFQADDTFSRLTQVGRIGDSGETYAFNRSGLLISNSRFNKDLYQIGLLDHNQAEAILNIHITDPGGNMFEGFKPETKLKKQPLTVMAESAVSGISDVNVQGYRDYRGVKVLGAWLWNDNLGYGLATEIDEYEALSSYRTAKKTAFVFVFILLLIIIALVSVIFWLERKSKSILKESNVELEKKISDLKYLQGIIPICSYCKNIRNDEGSWNQVEHYILKQTDADFSHGICPTCLEKARQESGLIKNNK